LNLKCDFLVSKFAFKVNLHRYAVEAFLSTASTPVTDAAALHAIRLISTYLRPAVRSPPDEFNKARDMLTYAEFLAGLAFNSAGLGLTHAMSNQICALYPNVPLSECTAVILPHVLQYYGEQSVENDDEENVTELFVDLAAALGCPAAAESPAAATVPAVVRSVARLASDVKLPETLNELNARRRAGMKKDDIPEVAAKALTDPGGITAPCDPTLGKIESLFCRAWDTGLTGAAEVGSLEAKPAKETGWNVRCNRVKASEYLDFNDAAAMIEETIELE
jgi:alcohol dehydrogenase